MKDFDISVIIINYNTTEYTINCVDSIIENVNKNLSFNIIIVDNNSTLLNYEKLASYYLNSFYVKIVRSKLNLGFSGGNMFGVQFTNAKYLFFLNNDTILINDCLTILYDFIRANKNVGICTAQMYDSDNTIHHSFGYFPTLSLKLFGASFLRIFNANQYHSKKNIYTTPIQVPLVTGAAMFVDFEKFSAIGGFDTNYFLYCEEEDIAMRMKNKGYSAYLVPNAKFVHLIGKSTIRNYDIEKENFISLLYYHRKYSSFIDYNLLKLYYFFKTIKKTYKHLDYLKLSIFILSGADLKHSIKHKIKISN
jgi:GT2 family glycosyltransferase